jgi:hypothetical protein
MSRRNLMKKRVTVVFLGAVCLAIGCGEEASSTGSSTSSSSSGGGGTGGGDAGGGNSACYKEPKTHDEIINACTDAEKIVKVVNMPLLEADGSLPPLP